MFEIETKGKTPTAVKNEIRQLVFEKLIEIAVAECDEFNVSIVGNATLAIAVAETDKNGKVEEICIELKPIVKDFTERKTPSKIVKAYNRFTEAKAYEVDKSEKERKAEEKARAKAKKIEHDKKKREEKKKESEKE